MQRLRDPQVDRVIQELERRVTLLESTAGNRGLLVQAVQLADGADTVIRHGLGRRATPFVSPARDGSTTGRIEEVRSASVDRRSAVVLRATGWGATITVDVWVT